MTAKKYSLIIDTSTKESLIGIFNNSKVVDENIWFSNNNESRTLLPNLKKMIESNDITIRNIKEIYTVIGPGGFSSLRIGMSIAKGLGITNNLKLIPIPSLLISGYEYLDKNTKILSILKCSKTTFYIKDYTDLSFDKINNQTDLTDFEVVESDQLNYFVENNYLIVTYDKEVLKALDNKLGNKVRKTKNRIDSIISLGKLIKSKYKNISTISINPIYANSGQIESALKVKEKGVKNWNKR
tara:strand:+ start:1215 stop:1937 length:723 start_codon:yes stop_codon:yes gene_type:complete